MKPLLMAHGEKLLLGAVILLGGYLVVGAVGSLTSPTTLTINETQNLEKVQEALKNNKPPKRAPLSYVKYLEKTFTGRTESQPLKASGVVSPTHSAKFYGLTPDTVTTVDGHIGAPAVFTAKASRGRVSLSWMACDTSHVAVERYEIYKKAEGQEQASLLTQTDGVASSYDDTKVAPEKEYVYYVQAVGRPNAPPGITVVNVRKASTEVRSGLWYPPRKAAAPALVPSNIDFECLSIFTDFGNKRAIILIKRWNNESNDWDKFPTDPGIAVDEPVIGKRVDPKNPMVFETFDSGYTLVLIEDYMEIEIIEVWEWVLGDDGKPVKKLVQKERKTAAQRIMLRKGDKEVTVKVGTGKSTMKKRDDKEDEPVDNRPTGDGNILDQIKAQMGERAGSTRAPKKEAAQSGDTKIFSSQNGFKFKVPVEWSNASIDMIDGGPYSDGLKTDLKEGFDKALKMTIPDGLIVVQHHTMVGGEYKAFTKKNTDDDAQTQNLGKEVLIPRMQAVIKGSTVLGDPNVLYSSAGAKLCGVAVSSKEGAAEFVVARYCVPSLPNLHLITFICRKADFDAQKGTFEKVAKSLSY